MEEIKKICQEKIDSYNQRIAELKERVTKYDPNFDNATDKKIRDLSEIKNLEARNGLLYEILEYTKTLNVELFTQKLQYLRDIYRNMNKEFMQKLDDLYVIAGNAELEEDKELLLSADICLYEESLESCRAKSNIISLIFPKIPKA